MLKRKILERVHFLIPLLLFSCATYIPIAKTEHREPKIHDSPTPISKPSPVRQFRLVQSHEDAKILNGSWEWKEIGAYCSIDWRVEVKNNTSQKKAIEVKVAFYTISGNILDTHKRGVWSNIPPYGTDIIGGGLNYSCSKSKPAYGKAWILDVHKPLK